MDIDEYQDRSLEVGTGLHSLSNKLYDAIEDEAPFDELQKLFITATNKIKQYENLYDECSEVWKKGLEEQYLDYIKRLDKYRKRLIEKYPAINE